MSIPAILIAFLGASSLAAQEPTLQDLLASDDPLAAILGHVAEREMESGRIPGAAVAVVRDGELIFAQGFGLADLEQEIPVVADQTRFRIGSITKIFTTLALTQAIDAGELGYDDPVAPLVKRLSFDNGFDEPVRVRHLLTHTAGLDQIGLDRQVLDPDVRPSLNDFLRDRLIVVRPPGTVSCYDTYGVTLAGYLLEVLSGKPYADCVRERIFEPLTMKQTYVETPAVEREHLALGYGLGPTGHQLQPYEWYVTLPASSIDSTATDMAKLMIALLGDGGGENGRVLSAAATRRVQRTQYRDHPAIPGFTHGFWEQERYGDEHPSIHHGGTMRGYSSEMTLFVEDGIGVFVACNRDGETGPYVNLHLALVDSVFEVLLGEIPRGGPSEPKLTVDTARFAGRFTDTLHCHSCPEGEGWPARQSWINAVGPGVLEFSGRRWVAIEPLVFQAQGGRDRVAFREDEAGVIRYAFTSNRSFERLD